MNPTLPSASFQLLVSKLLSNVRLKDHDAVIILGKSMLSQMSPNTDPSTVWLVQEAICTAAHETDNYELMNTLAEELLHTAHLMDRPDLHIMALCKSSTAKRCLGDGGAALDLAEDARVQAANFPDSSPLRVQVLQVLLAALVETGQLHEAWKLHNLLDSSLHLIADLHEQGKAYWTLGNLAFLVSESILGMRYHDRAATLLSPTKDMLLWARFNRASAELRLQAGLLEPATSDCLSRAEIAFGLVQPGELDRVGLCMTKSRFVALGGDPILGLKMLEEFSADYSGSSEHLIPLYRCRSELLALTDQPELADEKQKYITQIVHEKNDESRENVTGGF
ncbi:hypothetical protein OF385_15270 [Glutamicibacter sp. JL.03c]|uniref:hypothetical protein n=1 Tax=Glutamicibacter sp. JL.03c TaxID=2984842 RepID=UPI0021F74F88|nr:hypothetical protein [Glutamicibacter sp. JL.03c]UYQ77355.1 hypothetical protein OF385_15270 [Glutamicibacter sp. JL.03c]